MLSLHACNNNQNVTDGEEINKAAISNNEIIPNAIRQKEILDADGNAYSVIQLDNQYWTASNLMTSTFSNGDPIRQAKSAGEWFQATQSGMPVFAWFNYDQDNKEYGAYYNWYAVNDSRGLAPEDWMVVPNKQFRILSRKLNYDAHHLKEKMYWADQPSVFNSTGFSARPAGLIRIDGEFASVGEEANFWTSTEKSSADAMHVEITNQFNSIRHSYLPKELGMSVRLFRKEKP
jgi:uncharacterized protein (TIGR02145 family)